MYPNDSGSHLARREPTFDRVAWEALIRSRVGDDSRLAAVADTGLLDSGPDDVFDRLTRLAAAVLVVPWAFVTLVDDHRSFWKSCFGTGAIDPGDRQNPVDESFCQYVVATGEALLIDDARRDERTRKNPAIESMGVAAWAGFPILSSSGHVLGTFCVVDSTAHAWSETDRLALGTLAGAAASEIQLRTALFAAEEVADELTKQLAMRHGVESRLSCATK